MRTRCLPGELDQLTARLNEILCDGPGDLQATSDPNEGTPVGWCLGNDGDGRRWHLVTDGPLGYGAKEDAEALADLYNAVPVLIDALVELATLREKTANENCVPE